MLYTAIIIEPRKHKALLFVLDNFLKNLSDDSIIDDNFISNKRIIEAYNYLCNFDNSDLTYKKFNQDLLYNL